MILNHIILNLQDWKNSKTYGQREKKNKDILKSPAYNTLFRGLKTLCIIQSQMYNQNFFIPQK